LIHNLWGQVRYYLDKKKIILVEPFFTGSHKKWAEQLAYHSKHHIDILSLPGRHWKWRMHGAAITLAESVSALKDKPDLFLVTDMIQLSVFKALISARFPKVPIVIYFHENQITYPWSQTDPDLSLRRDNHYGFINYTSALIADLVLFNSHFHMQSFLDSLPKFLHQFPDHKNLTTIETIKNKSKVLYVGINKPNLIVPRKEKEPKTILWNHRWEYDKNPELFFKLLQQIKAEKIKFCLIVVGESTQKHPAIFNKVKEMFREELIHFGYVDDLEKYFQLLQVSDLLPVTAIQDFFGISTIEAIAYGVHPLLPNRLVYPEHIPEEQKGVCLYDTDEDLYQKMKSFLTSSKPSIDFSWVERYYWDNLIEEYDKVFNRPIRVC